MDSKKAVDLSLDLIKTSSAAYLTTVDEDGFPQTRAMLNLWNSKSYPYLTKILEKNENEFVTYFTTNTSSNKIKQIQNNSRVSVYYSKPREWKGLMLGGEIKIVNDNAVKEEFWQKEWSMYYPGGVSDPDYAILVLKPSILKLYHKLDFFNIKLG